VASSLFDDESGSPGGGPSSMAPLAERMRPATLDEVVGQEALVGPEGLLRRALSAGSLPSLILWGPPGTGKTTVARLLAHEVGATFFPLSAVTSGVKEVRAVVEQARRIQASGRRSVLFIDEIHRFHRGQQDHLLPHVESGTVIVIGATTENPAHTVVAPLLSRARVLVLRPLTAGEVVTIVQRAIDDTERGLGQPKVSVDEEVIRLIAADADGDARRALTTLEIAADLARARAAEGAVEGVTADDVTQAAQRRLLRADRQGDVHYDLASAFIKSLRGSDADAAAYYLIRMIESGVDPRFVTRRMIIFASEDVGLADPRALQVAVAAGDAYERLGLPEGTLPLVEGALYLATTHKSNSVIRARNAATELVREAGEAPIPDTLRDASASLSKQLGHGKGYRYPHDEPGHHASVDYLPEKLRGRTLYSPSSEGEEKAIGKRLKKWREAVRAKGKGRGDG
jgi:putative ATPase